MAKGFELRINSLEDAKSVVQHLIALQQRAEALNCTHIEIHCAKELEAAAKQIVPGVFSMKTFWKTVQTLPDNVLGVLPVYQDFRLQQGKKKGGRPLGSKNKKSMLAV